MIERVATKLEGDERVDPRWLNPSPRTVRLLPRDDPALGGAISCLSNRMIRNAIVAAKKSVGGAEEALPREDMARPGQRIIDLASGRRVQLVEESVIRYGANRA